MAKHRVYPPIQIGDRFGKLMVLGAGEKQGRRNTIKCQCECGKVRDFVPGNLNAGKIVSCFNCSDTFGLSKTPEYQAWYGMIRRCYDPRDRCYHLYGGRGITVCERWRTSFGSFLSDMGPRPSSRHSIDRRDNSLGYTAKNCRWCTTTQQARNRRITLTIETPDGRMPLAEAAERHGLSYETVYQRIFSRGWPVARALAVPARITRLTPR